MTPKSATVDALDPSLRVEEPIAANVALPFAIRLSNQLHAIVDAIGRLGSWMAVILILVTVFDLAIRSTGTHQIWLVDNVSPLFRSTLLQELEWHSHTVLFTLVLGYGYIWNTHVRVDLVRERLDFRRKVWIEFLGLSIFLIPFTSVVIYFAVIFALDSYAVGEISASLVGLSHRWIIKSVLAVGLVLALLAGIAVWLQVAVVLFGPKNIRFPLSTVEWPEETGKFVEGKQRLDLDEIEDPLEARIRAEAEKRR